LPIAQPIQSSTTVADETIAALKAQTAEMKRSEDRLLSTVHWALAAVVGLGLGLAAFGWWSAFKLYERDLRKVKEELLEELRADLRSAEAEIERRVNLGQQTQFDRLQADAIAYTCGKERELRLAIGDVIGSIHVAFEQYSAAQVGNANYKAHAITGLVAGFDQVAAQNLHVDRAIIEQARRTAAEFGQPDNQSVRQLNAVLNKLDPTHGA
jgi:hypothetical protein